jgi:hypothetical protein
MEQRNIGFARQEAPQATIEIPSSARRLGLAETVDSEPLLENG